ncbi:disease resistance protein RPV1-like isoform X6 [Quercus robur]|uniref:disease resistance protein RPV1-like isoform X6 n=1 Tax=Quercus robur TaxID=38942 RepID=UPI0021630328|nr:disease resistance protein RPV1-like isoform X6 [Quercus robur]
MALLDMKTDSSSFPSSSSAAVRWNYDVFLSFRGKDTRYNFVGHLYEALIQKGIHIFKDDINLDRGRPILPELLKAIGESRFAIVIISEDYASSDSCLVELAHIIHCKKEMGMTILPVFHHVDPSNIRKQLGTFEQAFIEHEKKENKETVEKWRDALREVGSLSGWHLKEYCSEIENIKDIVGCISLHLKYDALPYIAKDLVGINSRMEEFESHLALGSNDVRFIGIWGMGGMGKTTLARVVYYMVSIKFEACSFIEDVRERSERDGLVTLQQDLISDILKGTDLKIRDKYDGVINIRNRLRCKRILLVLDDVDKLDQLKFLVGEHDWFGPGSRIIITTRDEHVLKTHEVNEIYEVDGLNDEHALRLFSSKAFKGKHVPNDYLELSKHFLNYARGLPLALEVLGSFLNGKSIAEWKSALERLKDFPERIILQALKISFDGLRDAEKEIFLHIACFLNHKEKDHVLEVLDSLGLHPVIGLKELIDKSLLKITYMHIVWMHDLLEEMGKDIVRNECLNDPGKRSRLWCYKDIESVLKKNKGMKAVQAMHILCNYDKDEHEVKETCWSPEAISQMYNLKFLRIYGIFQDPQHLPNSLRVLCWSYYPSNSLPSTFQPDELVMLCLPHSRNEQLCIGIKNFDKLKIIDLSSSGFIISPDFTGVPNLEKLNLSSCQKLRELHPSVGILKKLVHFDLKFCENLVCLPNTICSLNSLERLDLCGCSNFDNLPENLGNLKGLKMLYLSGTAIKELPSSIDGLTTLTSLTLNDCKNLVCLPSTICSLKLLERLDLSRCSNFDNLPENLGNLKGLEELYLSGTAIKELPSSIDGLTTLTSLTLNDCKNLVCLPSSLNSLERLDFCGRSNFDNLPENLGNLKGLKNLHLSGTAIKELPSSIDGLTTLTSLTLNDCKNLVCLPSTICSLKLLECLDLYGCSNFDNLPENLGNLKGLEELYLSGTAIKELPSSIDGLTALTLLSLKDCENLVCLPSTICSLKLLERLDLSRCSNFDNLPENLGNLKGLKELNLSGTSIKELPSSIDGLTALTSLTLQDCENLVCLPSTICSLKLLECLDLYGCSNFDNLPENLGNLKGLKNLHLSGTAIKELPSSIDGLTTLTSLTLNDCKNLVCLPSIICSLNSLERLDLYGCSNFDNLPENLGNLKGLKNLHLSGTAIKELPSSIDGLTTLTSLTLNDCKNLVCLPSTICSLNSLERLDLCGCSNFDNLLENLGNLNGLKNLHLSGTAIKELPSSIDGLTTLTSLTLWSCRNLVCLPNTICCLISLECLEISGCSSFEYLPENLGNVKGLKKLGLSGSAIKELPSSIERLMHLTSLNLLDCFNLGCLPNTTCGFKFHGTLDLSTCSRFKNLPEMPWIIEGLLMLDLSNTVIEEMPSSIGRLTDLTALTLRFCMNLVRLPSTICSWKSLESLDLLGCLKFKNLPKNIGNMKDLEVLNLCWTSIIEFPSSIVLLKNLKHLYIRGWKLSEFYSQSASLELMDPLWNLPFSQPTSPQECIGLPSFLYSSLPTSPVLVGLLLPSLSGLHSLTYLCINDCDLLSIPDDIGCLSSLECLNLSGNNFVSLPESMSQLFNLRRLYLEGCKRLQSLGNVLSTIDSVIANDCSSLERLPELQFYPFMSNHSLFQCFNCFKLVDYIQNGSNMLQGLPNIVIPGGEIPKWFSNEFQGDNIQLSFPGCDELMGIVLCVVFVPNGSHQYHRNWNFTCIFQLNGLKIADFSQSYYFTTKYGRIESPHIWLLYLSTHRSVSNWGKICSRIDANGFRQLKIQIFAEVVEKIGVQLVYKQDMEDPNQTMAQCISNNSTLYEDFGVVHHDIDNSPIESSRNKQSRDVDDGAGPSGEGYSNEEPQPKWIQGEIFDYFAMEGGDQISKKLESIHGGKEDIYQDIEDPNQTLTQLSINSRKLYEELGDLSHDSYNSAAEGSRIKRRLDEEDGAGPSGEGYSNNEPHPKTRRMYG